MVHPRRTPWSTLHEWTHVHDSLFAHSASTDSQLDALATVNVWIARGNCPHAVESTAALLTLVLRDSRHDHVPHSTNDLRLSYSMAIVRFVNSLVDPLQTTYFARSIASLAQQIQLPLWFVELRHQATHEDLPSLGVLRDAARQALDWLYTYYWKRPNSRNPSLSPDLLALWTPLITHLDSLPSPSSAVSFSDILVKRGVDILCAGEGEMADKSYAACVGAWVGELMRDAPVYFSSSSSLDPEEPEEEEGAVTVKSVVKTCLISRTPALRLTMRR
ncbi:amino acid transporter [Rhodotorula toruloides]|uniref:Amino acid transporter n=1 Tax=Rhodotorula toruloides TaxID=5286 RepID=A0A511KL73_RHOTO|nr:amino acid transporter [Rhodotorula toruloides]